MSDFSTKHPDFFIFDLYTHLILNINSELHLNLIKFSIVQGIDKEREEIDFSWFV